MATRLTILWFFAATVLALFALAEAHIAFAFGSSTSSNKAKAYHQGIVKAIKGKWTSMWEFPIQKQSLVLARKGRVGKDNASKSDASSSSSSPLFPSPLSVDVALTNAAFIKDMKANGFGLVTINGTLGWVNRTTGVGPHSQNVGNGLANRATAATAAGSSWYFGELDTDDTLVWSINSPDHSAADKVAAFEIPSTSTPNTADASSSPPQASESPEFFFPIFDAALLSKYETFNGQFKPPSSTPKSADDPNYRGGIIDLANNPMIKASLRKVTSAMRNLNGESSGEASDDVAMMANTNDAAFPIPVPSYGYVLCGEAAAVVPTHPHLTDEAEYFTVSRRVSYRGDNNDGADDGAYVTQAKVYKGFIFPIATASITAEEAEKQFCSSSSSSSSLDLTPLTITTVGAYVDATGFGLFGRGNLDGYWELDSVVFDFGLLPHERRVAESSSLLSSDEDIDAADAREEALALIASGSDDISVPPTNPAAAAFKKTAAMRITSSVRAVEDKLFRAQEESLAVEGGSMMDSNADASASPSPSSSLLAQHPLMQQLRAMKKDADELFAEEEASEEEELAKLSSMEAVEAEAKQARIRNSKKVAAKAALAVEQNTLRHRITLRRLHRPDHTTLTGAFSDLLTTYWQTILVAVGFVLFRMYAGFRYNSKKVKTTRQLLAQEEEKLRAAKLKKLKTA